MAFHNGSVKLLGYQVVGPVVGELPNWRWMEVNLISELHLLNQNLSRWTTKPLGKHHQWDQPLHKGRSRPKRLKNRPERGAAESREGQHHFPTAGGKPALLMCAMSCPLRLTVHFLCLGTCCHNR